MSTTTMIAAPTASAPAFRPHAGMGAAGSPDVAPTTGGRILRLVQSSDGRGLRGLSGRKAIGSASIATVKAAGSIQIESGPEDRYAKRAEFDRDIVRIRSQPVRVEGVDDGVPFTYFPDFAVLRADGRRDIVEVKGSRRQLRDPVKRRRLDLAAECFAAHGYGFVIHVDEDAGHPAVLDENVARMMPSRLTVVTERHKARVGVLLRDVRETTLGAVVDAVGEGTVRGTAVAYAMQARRLIDIDLTIRLGPRSRVSGVSALPAVMPPLRF